ncbi:MAG: hypothetical protein C4295_10605 [Candidatus Fervidibacterota bacterium]
MMFSLPAKLKRFLALPLSAKLLVLRRKLGLVNRLPLLVRLPDIGWWMAIPASKDRGLNDLVWHHDLGERRFLRQFIQPNWLVMDIGAHWGFYTLLLARLVGPKGRVIAFEPSPRERKWLQRHLWLNRHTNVRVEPFAICDEEGETELFLYSINTSVNSLRPQFQWGTGQRIKVATTTLDAYLKQHDIEHVHFIKIDAEGAELKILTGAKGVLEHKPRPVFLCELNDKVTQAWGYAAKDIRELLTAKGFYWFDVSLQGNLIPHTEKGEYSGNLVAFPEERLSEARPLLERDTL